MNNKKWSELNGHPLSTFLMGEDKYIFSFFLFFVFPSISFHCIHQRKRQRQNEEASCSSKKALKKQKREISVRSRANEA